MRLSRIEFTPTRQEPSTLVSGKVVSGTDVEQWFGRITQDMKVNGSSIRRAEKENSFIPTVIFMMAHGLITKQMVTEFTQTLKELATKDIGKMINRMVRV
jgi:hypothetical protein